jgi:RNA polymerase sigma factor (sigma-70 family)
VELDSNTIRFFQGDTAAIEQIYRTEFPVCRVFVLRNHGTYQDAEDCFQEAIIATYRSGRGPCLLLGVRLEAFLFGIIKKLWYKCLRDRKETIELVLDAYEQTLIEQSFLIEESDLNQYFKQALGALSESCRDLLTGFYVYGAYLKEIAEDQGLSEQGTKNKKAKCLEQLRRRFNTALTLSQHLIQVKTN